MNLQGKGVMETFWLIGHAGMGHSSVMASSSTAMAAAAPPPPPSNNSNPVFRARESTPPMEDETRLSSADSPDLPNYDEAKGMYRQAAWN